MPSRSVCWRSTAETALLCPHRFAALWQARGRNSPFVSGCQGSRQLAIPKSVHLQLVVIKKLVRSSSLPVTTTPPRAKANPHHLGEQGQEPRGVTRPTGQRGLEQQARLRQVLWQLSGQALQGLMRGMLRRTVSAYILRVVTGGGRGQARLCILPT